MEHKYDRRKFMKYGFMGLAAFGSVMAPYELKLHEGFELERGLNNVSLEESAASAVCGFAAECSGGGGTCGFAANCAGGGGRCGFAANCAGS